TSLSMSSADPLAAVSAVFGSIGRVLICLDDRFRVVHASAVLARLAGDDVAAGILVQPVADLLGDELFGPAGTLGALMEKGEMREGGRATMLTADTPRLMSLTAAPFVYDERGVGDPRMRYVLILRPAEEDPLSGTVPPTTFFGMIARSASM